MIGFIRTGRTFGIRVGYVGLVVVLPKFSLWRREHD